MPITAVLLDLDDTLITTNMRQFIPAYLKLLSQALSDFAPPARVGESLLEAIEIMRANTNPTVTNYQAFYRAFLPRLNGSYDEIQPVIQRFYRETFPQLRKYVAPRSHARPLLEYLTADGYQVAVATNPLFPRVAIEQRMAWGGVLDFPYALITTMETTHYSKPNPDYYQEILTRIGVSPDQALMVGDDPENDIVPARRLGLETWQITDLTGPLASPAGDHQGALAEFYQWVAAQDEGGRMKHDE